MSFPEKENSKNNLKEYNPWVLNQDKFDEQNAGKYESLFTLGNGNLGLRGNLEELSRNYENGTFLNGFYNTSPINYGESAYGYAKRNQAIVNIVDGKGLQIYADGELLTIDKVKDHNRELDIKKGILTRKFSWSTESGGKIDVKIERLVSLFSPAIALQILEIEVAKKSVDIEIISSLTDNPENYPVDEEHKTEDPRTGTFSGKNTLIREDEYIAETRGFFLHSTMGNAMTLFSGMDHLFSAETAPVITNRILENKMSVSFKLENVKGKIYLNKYLSYHYSSNNSNLKREGLKDLDLCIKNGSFFYLKKQKEFLAEFWSKSDLIIEGNEKLQFGIRFNLFHLLQSTGRNGKVSISAKGLTGSGYEGHFFWDTEIYVLPYFIYTFPKIARSLLSYRYSIIEKAKLRAQELSHKGVLFPWRTINGEEASAYYPAGTAQYHINADIAFGINQYIKSTEDRDFLLNYGIEVLIETARFWYDLGEFIPGMQGAFCIHEVTGPDEYTTLVNNNLYTNIMAKENLLNACAHLEDLKNTSLDIFNDVMQKFNLSEMEITDWTEAARKMRIPYSSYLSLYAQDDAFLNRPVWDFDGTPENKYPLLLHFHPLTIYRYQVIKQADLVMALFLQGKYFSLSDKKRNFDYYERLTTGDSSLSACIQGIIGMEIGYLKLGAEYFKQTTLIDINDFNGNVKDGLHTASMAGSWMMVIYGFAGMRDFRNKLSFSPRLHISLDKISFKINYSSCLLLVEISTDFVIYTLLEGESFSFYNYYTEIQLMPGESKKISLLPELNTVFIDSALKISSGLSSEIKKAGLKYSCLNEKDSTVPPPDPEMFLDEAERLKLRRWDCLCITSSTESVKALESAEIASIQVEKIENITMEQISAIYEEFSKNWNYGILYL